VPRYSTSPPQAPQPPARQPGRVLRAVALTAVSVGVLVLAAAAFVLSYSGIHAVAQQAGVSATLARGYPVIFDALLVIACAAVLSLRGAGAVSRFYAWLSLLVLLGATAGADALHSTGTAVPHRTAALVAAIIPWILLLIGFGLLLAMLRHFRLHRAAPPVPALAREARRPAGPPALPPGPTQAARPRQLPEPPVAPEPPAPAPPPAAAPASPAPAAAGPPVSVPPQAPSERAEPISAAGPAAPAGPDLADLDSDSEPDDPATEDPADAAVPEEIFAAPPPDSEAAQEPASQPARPPGPQPAFHRMWSSPTPPGDEDED
jgi:Protein of unknown function (DUF2637)